MTAIIHSMYTMFYRGWFVIKYWLYWVLFFEAARLLFLVSNFAEIRTGGGRESFLSLWHGLQMDLSTAAYITLPISVFVLLSVFIGLFRNSVVYLVYTLLVLLLVLFIVVADVGLFRAWGFRIDATALRYLTNPKEVWASISHLPILVIAVVFLLVYFFLIFVCRKLLRQWEHLLQPSGRHIFSFALVLLLTVSFIVPIRGGIQLAPLNQSSVYFSQNNFSNQAALNASWNLVRSLSRRIGNTVNPFIVADTSLVNKVVDSLLANRPGAGYQRLPTNDTTKPNVIIIVWESFTSKAVDLRVDGKEITPGFNKLTREGVYFSNIYATGDRTDKGIVGILSGYPAQPITSIIKEPTKAAKLPMLSKMFRGAGYETAFYYGGELEFANMKAYLLQGGFNRFVTVDDFKSKDKNSKWGAHDGVVMDRLKQDLLQMPQPFFSTWLTLSSHEPYQIPWVSLLPEATDGSKFLSSLHYSDSVVYNFVEHARRQPWWANTLVVIVADHGHRLPTAQSKHDDFQIPLLFLGGALQYSNNIIDRIGSQTDIAASLLRQVNMPADSFKWSRNLFDSTQSPWAFFTFNNGFGLVQPGKQLVFDNIGMRPISKVGTVTEKDIFIGKAIQQAAFQDYLDR